MLVFQTPIIQIRMHIFHLFATDEYHRYTFTCIRQIFRRRANDAGPEEPGLHDFQRCFTLQCLIYGMDLLTVSRL